MNQFPNEDNKETSPTSLPAPVSEEILELLEKELPSFFPRTRAVKALNGIFTYQTLSNYESRKIGPPVHYMGRVACYTKESFIEWLRNYFGGMSVNLDGFGRRLRRGEESKENNPEE